jgi:hypothetical protein
LQAGRAGAILVRDFQLLEELESGALVGGDDRDEIVEEAHEGVDFVKVGNGHDIVGIAVETKAYDRKYRKHGWHDDHARDLPLLMGDSVAREM